MRRRSVIKSVGGVTAFGMISPISANETTISHNELGEKVAKARRTNNDEKARQLLEEHGITEYNLGGGKVEASGENDGVSTQARFSETESTFDVNMWETNVDDHYFIQAAMNLSGQVLRLRSTSYVDDIIGFTFNDDHWSLGNISETAPPEVRLAGEGEDWHEVDLDGYDPNETGVTAAADLAGDLPTGTTAPEDAFEDDVSIIFEMWVQDLDGSMPPIMAEYFHTRGSTPSASIDSITIGVDGPLGLDVSVSGRLAGHAWTDTKYTELD